MKRRLLAVILSLVLCLPVLASCDTKTEESNTQSESLVESATESTTASLPESDSTIDTASDSGNDSETFVDTASNTENDSNTVTESDSAVNEPTETESSSNETESESLPTSEESASETESNVSSATVTPATEAPTESETEKKPASSDASRGLEFTEVDGGYAVSGIGSCRDINITIPRTYNGSPVIEIGDNAFANNSNIKSVKTLSNIVRIGANAFYGCSSLTSVLTSSGLSSIGASAFQNCSSLTSVNLPQSLSSAGNKAFYGCESLTEIVFKGTVEDASDIFDSSNVMVSVIEKIICSDGIMTIENEVKKAEFDTYFTTTPDNWNCLNYQGTHNSEVADWIVSNLFDYDYKFKDDQKYNSDGTVNKDAIIPGAYTTNFSAATKLEDVTALVDAKWGYTPDQKTVGGYAWKVTLRDDLRWDDGTYITADDFVYSMQQLLDPDFQNFRAYTFYDSIRIKNAEAYYSQNREGYFKSVSELGFNTNGEAIDAGYTIYIDSESMWGTNSTYVDEYGNPCPKWLAYNDETVYTGEYNGEEDPISGAYLWTYYSDYIEVNASYSFCAAIYVENALGDIAWEDVGFYTVEGENAFIICLDSPIYLLMDDGELSYLAAYSFASFPLVHREKYEACKIPPAEGETLWTSSYCTSPDTSASWGPYKLVELVQDSRYRLELNEYWYGWNMEEFQNQYNVTAINYNYAWYWSEQWIGFLSGDFDYGHLNTENAEYSTSKYLYFTSNDTGTFGIQLYSNLDVLRESDNNNGILAITAFRQAINLAIDRSALVARLWPNSAIPCFGLVNSAYYYDIYNSPSLPDGGHYRNTTQAKEGILRAYGYVQSSDGSWSIGDESGLTLDQAYASLTGYNPTLAKEKMIEAIEELISNADYYGYDPDKNIVLVLGASVDNLTNRNKAEYMQSLLDELASGTALEGRFEIVFDASAGLRWAEAFRSGQTQIGFGYGFSGNAFDPFDIVGGFLDPYSSLNYHGYWDTASALMTVEMPEGDYPGAGETITMSILNWYFCLNGLAELEGQPYTYNWDEGNAPAEARLTILSAIEEVVISESRSIMIIANSTATFLGAQFSYITDVENAFMGFGSFRYMEVNYTDEEWDAYVAEHGYDLTSEYSKTE